MFSQVKPGRLYSPKGGEYPGAMPSVDETRERCLEGSTSHSLQGSGFQYTYDCRGRVSSKKLPGCSPIHYEYDNADRVRRMQDGVLAEQGKWRVYEYDRIGRMTRQVISNGSGIRYDEIVNYYDNYIFLTDYASDAQLLPLLSPKSQGHSRGMQTGALQRASNGEILLSVLSYDDYGRMDKQV